MLDWLGLSNAPNWRVARPLGWFVGAVLTVALPLLFFASLAAAGATIWHTITLAVNGEQDGINLGAGALIAALLGAPFVIWGTVLKHQTVRYQKEGHITDRINKAVEQLGAEKTVDRIGRAVTFSSGNPEEMNLGEQLESETLIEWQGKPLEKEGWWRSKVGQWQVFSETQPNIEVRIGAILSLERIAQDSTRYDKGRDHVRVMEILCAYVRENSNATPPQDYPEPDWEPLKDDAAETERAAHLEKWEESLTDSFFHSKARTWTHDLPEPRPDIAMVLRVLGRRTSDQRRVEAAWPEAPDNKTTWPFDNHRPELLAQLHNYSGYRLDLRGANLQRVDISAQRPDASDAVFSGAILKDARLQGANFSKARLEWADLSHARMTGATLEGANMRKADIIGAYMEGVNLSRAQLQEAVLVSAWLDAADCSGAQMDGVLLSGARTVGAVFSGARMHGAQLFNAKMQRTIFHFTLFDAATDWEGAVLNGSSVRGVDFSDAYISADQLNSTFGDYSTEVPDLFTRPEAWSDVALKSKTYFDEYRKWLSNPSAYTPPQKPD